MKNTFGESVSVTLFGESHGKAIGIVLDGLAPGIEVDTTFIKKQLELRKSLSSISTKRREYDEFSILSGVFNGYTTGSPICIVIPNSDIDSRDYDKIKNIARPGHADYSAYCKYHGYNDYRGGGHFSGRITAAIVAAGAIAILALRKKGIEISTHIKSCAGVDDRDFDDLLKDQKLLREMFFPVLDVDSADKMKRKIIEAKNNGDSVGGILQTVITGVESGIGEPWFDTVEGVLSHALFSIPGIKGVEFGKGFSFSNMFGSSANDSFLIKDKKVVTTSNNNAGINGGITNSMPIVFQCAVKPTPSIYKNQKTINFKDNKNVELLIEGRHDPAIVHRARVVVDSMAALTLCDLLSLHFGTDWLANTKLNKGDNNES